MKVLITGDFCQRYRVNQMIDRKDFSMFDSVKPIIKSCDVSIVNFEFPIISDKATPIGKVGPVLSGTKSSISAILAAGFNVCTLANNHILDLGEKCCLDTKNSIEEKGIKTVGVGKNIQEASKILYIEISNRTLAIINCCEHEFSIATKKTAGANPLNVIKQYYAIKEAKSKADFVLVIVHAGIEHYQLPTPRMKENYHFFIDAGADAVINHHQHCFSGYEIYNNKPIFYGIGNFLFDSPGLRNSIWNEGYMVELDFNETCITHKIYPYHQANVTTTVELLEENQMNSFNSKIKALNEIIASDKKLQDSFEQYSYQNRRFILSVFTPWINKFLLSAFVRGLLPSFLSNRRKMYLKSRLLCESHYDLTIKELSR